MTFEEWAKNQRGEETLDITGEFQKEAWAAATEMYEALENARETIAYLRQYVADQGLSAEGGLRQRAGDDRRRISQG